MPVTVTVAGPVAAVALAVNVNTVEDAVVAGLNEAVTPLGRPLVVKVTFPEKPFSGAIVMVELAFVP